MAGGYPSWRRKKDLLANPGQSGMELIIQEHMSEIDCAFIDVFSMARMFVQSRAVEQDIVNVVPTVWADHSEIIPSTPYGTLGKDHV